MLGKSINSEQVKLYMKERKAGKSQEASAAKAGICERPGRRIEKGDPDTTKRTPTLLQFERPSVR